MTRLKFRYIEFYLEAAFFCLVFSQSIAFISTPIQKIFEYMGILFLIISLIHNELKSHFITSDKIYFFVILIGLNIGLITQNMSLGIKLKALIPSLVFTMIFTMSNGIVENSRKLRRISYSIIFALVLALLFALIFHVSLFEANGLGGKFYIGFNGGILYKNYYSSTVLSAFIGLYLSLKYSNTKTKIDYFLCAFLIILLFLSSSNGTYLILISFFGIEILGKITYKIKEPLRKRFLIMLTLFCGFAFLILFVTIALKNQNYLYRLNGLFNYINVYGKNPFYIIFGNGELAYAPGMTYVENIISKIGYDGSLELSWLGILIKNGLFGVITYIYIFLNLIKNSLKKKKKNSKIIMLAIIVALIVSSLVETYIQNLHVIFGIFMFILAFNAGIFPEQN